MLKSAVQSERNAKREPFYYSVYSFSTFIGRVRRPCRGLEKFPHAPVLQRCYGCSFDAQEIVHTGHGMLGFFLFLFERKVAAESKLKE